VKTVKTIATLLFLFNALLVLGQITNDETLVDYFTDNGFSAAVKTMQHPAGEYYKGVTIHLNKYTDSLIYTMEVDKL